MMDAAKGPTFALDISSPGAASLRDTVKTKLSDFLGSYTDDVLAEYVVVLVGHGKHQTQAIKDLEAFLGDQSEAFVTWLWEHLSTNIHLYTSVNTSKTGSHNDQAIKNGDGIGKERHVDSQPAMKHRVQSTSLSDEVEKPTRLIKTSSKDVSAKTHKNLDAITSSARLKTIHRTGDHKSEHRHSNSSRRTKRPYSPDTLGHRERSHSDDRDRHKRHASPRVNAPRRLLAAAVRDAVAPSGSHLKRSESSLKRLCSVVSAVAESKEAVEDGYEQPRKVKARMESTKQLRRSLPAMVVAMKAAAAAAEDVNKVRGRCISSVWDRLGQKSDQDVGSDDDEVVADESMIDNTGREETESNFLGTPHYENDRIDPEGTSMVRSDRLSKAAPRESSIPGAIETDSAVGRSVHIGSAKRGKLHAVETNQDFRRSKTYNDGRKVRPEQGHEESVTVQYRLAQNLEENAKETRKQVSKANPGLANSSQKIVNISVNVNTWKPSSYDAVKTTVDREQQITASTKDFKNQSEKALDEQLTRTEDEEVLYSKSEGEQNVSEVKKRMHQVQMEMTKLRAKQAEGTKETQKTSVASVSGLKPIQASQYDSNSRTVFVTNIHFAATKESVAAHFNRCGDILRVIMLTDAATGQPKGSAYVEFYSKNAAEKALTLNESSFLSRSLKVVRKDSAKAEATPMLVQPLLRRPFPLALRVPIRSRFIRGSPYLVRRISSLSRPYGNAPNLQWKRDSGMPTGTSSSVSPPFLNSSRPAYGPLRPSRSFSYVRSANAISPQPALAQDQKATDEHESQDVSDKAAENMPQELMQCDVQEQKSG